MLIMLEATMNISITRRYHLPESRHMKIHKFIMLCAELARQDYTVINEAEFKSNV